VDVDVAVEVGDEFGIESGEEVRGLLVGDAPAVFDGLIGVSAVEPGRSVDGPEQPATSTDAANKTAIRIGPG
jgi:hypothetical protein